MINFILIFHYLLTFIIIVCFFLYEVNTDIFNTKHNEHLDSKYNFIYVFISGLITCFILSSFILSIHQPDYTQSITVFKLYNAF